jgi:hypothetical protein
MGKYLTKEQVIADFKHNIMPQIVEAVGKADYDTLKHCWEVNLSELCANKEISESQRDKWTFPEDIKINK